MPRYLLAILLGALAACNAFTIDPATAILGRWQRVSEPGISEPEWLMAEFIEFRTNGAVISLLYDAPQNRFWSVGTGEYSLREQNQIRVAGTCWQSKRRFECERLYRLSLDDDHLRLFDESNGIRVEFKRIGTLVSEMPPTLVPPFPSPTPAR